MDVCQEVLLRGMVRTIQSDDFNPGQQLNEENNSQAVHRYMNSVAITYGLVLLATR